MSGQSKCDWLWPAIIVTAVYTFLVWMTVVVVVPTQQKFLPAITGTGIVLFLPHGVRVLTAWLYGWKSVAMLLPGSMIGVYLVYGAGGFELPKLWIVPLVAVCGYVGIYLARLMTPAGAQVVPRLDLNWKQIVAGCCLASVINSIGHGLILGLGGMNVLAFLVGDTLGTIVLMLILMLVFRWWRLLKQS